MGRYTRSRPWRSCRRAEPERCVRNGKQGTIFVAREAAGYMRTSSATNVGVDKNSEASQRAAIEGYAERADLVIVDWHYDAAVSGADPIESRPGFAALLDRIDGNGVRVVVVEDASRFARHMIAQELGIVLLAARRVPVHGRRR
jgi:DNA invertase Pin-like site-specific DNA recombinase